MRIAFDATVVHGRKSGVGYYCQELLRALVRTGEKDEYFVFSHLPLSKDLVQPGGNVSFAEARFCRVRAFYLHALLPGLLRREGADLVHFTNFLAPVRTSAPYVLTVHDMSMERFQSFHPIGKRVYTRRLVPYMAERARLIVTNSEFSKWDIVRFLGIEEERVRVTPLAASSIFRPLRPDQKKPVLDRYGLDRPYFLYLGNVEPRKNLERLLEAFRDFPDRDHQLVIVGDAWFRAGRVHRKAAELGLGERLLFLNYLARRDLAAVIGGATAFVYPSLLEGFGLPVLEAMACGRPVITSSSTSLAEVAGDAALLVDPHSTGAIRDALVAVSEVQGLADELSRKAIRRAAEFSWEKTAEQTRAAYRDAIDRRETAGVSLASGSRVPEAGRLVSAARRTLAYADQFDYPLNVAELHERLIGLHANMDELAAALRDSTIPVRDGWLTRDATQVERRQARETWSDQVITEFGRELATLASLPFVRMLAFSGATAHRNMTDRDIDIFAVVEDGKVWWVLMTATIWAKIRGIRANLCLNYVVSDRRLPLFQTDLFTAQQVASLKPFFGKPVYDRFLRLNPFVSRHFPNFNPALHRRLYPEIPDSRFKRVSEACLRLGPAQLLDWASRKVLRPYLRRKCLEAVGNRAVGDREGDVVLERSRVKLHVNSHRGIVLRKMGVERCDALADAVPGSLAPAAQERHRQDVQVQSQ